MQKNQAFQQLEESITLLPVEGSSELAMQRPPIPRPPTFFVKGCGNALVVWGSGRDKEVDVPTTIRFFAEVRPEMLDATAIERPLAIFPLESGPAGSCTHLAILHPSAARFSFTKDSNGLMELTYGVMPCFPCELSLQDSADILRCRCDTAIASGDLLRSPSPAVSMRFRYEKKRRTSTGSGLGVWPWQKFLGVVLPLREFDGFCEFENFEARRALLKHDAGGWELVIKKKSTRLDDEGVEPWLVAFFFHGEASAAEVLKSGGKG